LNIISLFVIAASFSSVSAFAACGDKGGPGYRDSNDKCVSWQALARSCGNPPTLRCTAERAQPEAREAAEQGARIDQFMNTSHDRMQGRGK